MNISKSARRFSILILVAAMTLVHVAQAATLRISHGSPGGDHPTHTALLSFGKLIEERLGGKYKVEVFPNAVLGPSAKTLELLQVGAIDFVLASTANFETIDNIYQIFSIPYLFESEGVYHDIMDNKEITDILYHSGKNNGFEIVTWFDAGTRNLYGKTPIRTPEDIKGKKFRVQANPTNIKMMAAWGASGVPMSMGEVYTALQQGVVDGGENNEVCIVAMNHGEVAKYWSYTRNQMMPDLLAISSDLWTSLSSEERKVVMEAAEECNKTQRANWEKFIGSLKKEATEKMGVTFAEIDVAPFKKLVMPLHEEVLAESPRLRPVYEKIMEFQNK